MSKKKYIENPEKMWKDVNGYEGVYEVSNQGDVRSVDRVIKCSNGKILNVKGKNMTQRESRGYKRVGLSKGHKEKVYSVHRLVAKAFILNEFNKKTVNHIDGNRSNNMCSNLEWSTLSENIKHSFESLGKKTHNRKLKHCDIIDIRNNCFMTKRKPFLAGNVNEFAEKYKVSNVAIRNIIKGVYYKDISL